MMLSACAALFLLRRMTSQFFVSLRASKQLFETLRLSSFYASEDREYFMF